MPTSAAPAVVAHAAHNRLLGAPEQLLEVGLVVAVVLTALALRSTWLQPRLQAAAGGHLLGPWSATAASALAAAASVLGALVWLLSLTAGLVATAEPTENLAPFVFCLPFLVGGGIVASLAVDGWWRAASPFATLARLVDREGGAQPADDGADGADVPTWTAPVMVASFLWLAIAFHDGGQVRPIGIWLALYTVAGVAGTLVWGRAWALRGEGFADLFGAIGRLAPLARDAETGRVRVRPPLSGLGGDAPSESTTATLLVTGAAVAFAALRALDWWQLEVVQGRAGWSRTAVDTVGLAFSVGLVVLVWSAGTGRARAGAAVVPLVAGVATAFLLTDLVGRSIDVLALLSDPYGQGWDLLGTADWFPDIQWGASPRLAWLELASVGLGAVLAAVAVHDLALADGGRRAADAPTARRELATATVLAVAAMVLLLR